VTLTTLGYGDITPRSEVGRGLAIVEAVAGQLYLAVLIARLVSLYAAGEGKGNPREAQDGSEGPAPLMHPGSTTTEEQRITKTSVRRTTRCTSDLASRTPWAPPGMALG
jgi:hypothetical protein